MRVKARFFYFLLYIFFLQTILVSVAAAATRIMPLGDSITQGYASGEPIENRQVSYRKALRGKLIAAGYDVDFVGSLNSGSTLLADPQHEGHPGWHANGDPGGNNLVPNVYNWLVASDPVDVVLLHIGTNDVSAGDADAAEVAAILDEIDTYSTDTWVILALIIKRSCDPYTPPCPNDADTTAFNDAVLFMANSRAGDKIVIVDMEDGAGIDYRREPIGDMDDDFHPYQDPTTGEAPGYAKMADEWFDALVQILPDPDPDPPNNSSSSNSGCFIGTAAYGSDTEPHIKAPVDFRDHFLLTKFVGRAFVDFYHSIRHLRLISTPDMQPAH